MYVAHVHICIDIYMYVCVYTHIDIYMYVCIHLAPGTKVLGQVT